MIVVDRTRTRWVGTPADLERGAREIRDRTCVHLPGFLDPALLDEVRALLERTAFVEHEHGGLAVDERAEAGALSALLLLVLNDPQLLRVVEKLAGCGPLGGFEGRVYRMVPGTRHFDSWHSDSGGNRRVALSINLNRAVVPTAPLQIRRRDSEAILHEFANATPGDAVLFKVDDAHVHRIKADAGAGVRIACSGWFYTGTGIRDRLREAAREG